MWNKSLVAVVFAFYLLAAHSSEAPGHGPCDSVGDIPSRIDPKMPSRIDKWTKSVIVKFGFDRMQYGYIPADAPTEKQKASIELQTVVAEWSDQVAKDTAESIFRQAVRHGVLMQYEMLMVKEDPSKSEDHRFWVGAEAWRSNECLKLIGREPRP